MHYKIHPEFIEPVQQTLDHHQMLAHRAQLDTLLLEFEHSEEFRACSACYLESPRIILDDFIHDTRLPPEHMDSEALAHGLLCVLPSRIIDLMPEDTHQIFREQISFWRFALAQWQLPYAAECLEILNLQTRDKLSKIIGLDRLSTENRVTFSHSVSPRVHHHLPLESPPTISEQDVRPLSVRLES